MDKRIKEAPANKQVMPYQEPHGARSAQGKLLEEAIGRQVKQHREKLGLTIAELAKAAGGRAMPLPVSAPFHCPLMQPAADAMAEALAAANLQAPLVPVFANVTAAPVSDPDEIRRLLLEQVTGTVRWRESVVAMKAAGVEHFVELGGKVVGPMVGRTVDDVTVTSVVAMADLEALAKEI